MPDWLTRAWRAPWLWMAIVTVLFGRPLFLALDSHDYDNDEAVYTFSVDMMLKTGDWLTPKYIPSETIPFLEKPPLKFLIVGLPIRWGLLPAHEFGMRFWDALMGSLAFLYVVAIGRRLAGPLCGLASVYLLFTHGPLVLDHGLRTNNMEAAVVLAYAGGMYHFLAWRSSGPDSRGHVLAMALYFVLGFMTKDVAALFLPLVILMTALLRREDRVRVYFHRGSFAIAAAVVIALIAPWFVYEYWLLGSRVFATMFGEHVVKRFTAYLDPAHLQPWHFYFSHLWSVLRLQGAALAVSLGAILVFWRTIRERWLEGALLVLWFVVPMTLISTGTSKLYHYAYPFLPPVALAGGYGIAKIAEWIWKPVRRATRGLGAGLRTAIPVVTAAAALLPLPLAQYDRVLAEGRRQAHPLRDLRECLTPIAARAEASGFGTPGVWVEGHGFTHRTYYLHRLGPWQQRDTASNATVAMHLFAPNDYRLVLLDSDRYDDFIAHLRQDPDEVIRAAARHTDYAPEVLMKFFRGSTVSVLPFEGATLLLPGPYGSCVADHLKVSSQ
jgi:4-amino-4-deoxy-L-arabinose transferase-like glycosyltransferase